MGPFTRKPAHLLLTTPFATMLETKAIKPDVDEAEQPTAALSSPALLDKFDRLRDLNIGNIVSLPQVPARVSLTISFPKPVSEVFYSAASALACVALFCLVFSLCTLLLLFLWTLFLSFLGTLLLSMLSFFRFLCAILLCVAFLYFETL